MFGINIRYSDEAFEEPSIPVSDSHLAKAREVTYQGLSAYWPKRFLRKEDDVLYLGHHKKISLGDNQKVMLQTRWNDQDYFSPPQPHWIDGMNTMEPLCLAPRRTVTDYINHAHRVPGEQAFVLASKLLHSYWGWSPKKSTRHATKVLWDDFIDRDFFRLICATCGPEKAMMSYNSSLDHRAALEDPDAFPALKVHLVRHAGDKITPQPSAAAAAEQMKWHLALSGDDLDRLRKLTAPQANYILSPSRDLFTDNLWLLRTLEPEALRVSMLRNYRNVRRSALRRHYFGAPDPGFSNNEVQERQLLTFLMQHGATIRRGIRKFSNWAFDLYRVRHDLTWETIDFTQDAAAVLQELRFQYSLLSLDKQTNTPVLF